MPSQFSFRDLREDEIPKLLDAIRAILGEVGAHNIDIYDEAYWRWQYQQLPSHLSHVFVALDGEKIVGYYHVPTYACKVDGRILTMGNVQDVAVAPEYRGKGLFRDLTSFANSQLNGRVDFIYTFPNVKSIRTFVKYDAYTTVASVPAYLLPVRSASILRSRINLGPLTQILGFLVDWLFSLRRPRQAADDVLVLLSEFDDEIAGLFQEHQERERIALVRDIPWLKWRYRDSPKGSHYIVGLRRRNRLEAVAVFKKEKFLGVQVLLLMDIAYTAAAEPAALSMLGNLQTLLGNGLPADIDMILTFGLGSLFGRLGQAGFVKVPDRFNPRKLNLLIRDTLRAERIVLEQSSDWLLTLGDWDVF